MTPRASVTARSLSSLARLGKVGAAAGLQLDLLRHGITPTASSGEVDPAARGVLYHRIWSQAAASCGATLTELGHGALRLSAQDSSTVVWHNMVMLDHPVTLRMAAHKPLATELLSAAGLPVPSRRVFSGKRPRDGEAFLSAHDGACVVKPAADTGAGNGVTCGVRTADDLARAVLRAARWGPDIVMEEQVSGDELRVLVLDGEVIGALRRLPPAVTGDGHSSVADLIAQANRRRAAARGEEGLWYIPLDLDALLALAAQGLTPRAVPPAGTRVVVSGTVNENGPSDNRTAAVSEPIARAAADAAAAVGLRLAAVEIVTSDPDSPLAGNGAVLEVNGTPGLHYHYQVADPNTVTDVASRILESLLAQGRVAQ